MRAVVCRTLGGRPVVEDVDDVVPGPGQVVVEVEAAGVTYVDALLVGGRYQFPVPVPFVPGGELVGHVVAVGSDVAPERMGQRCVAQVLAGAFAERVVVSAGAAHVLPGGVGAAVGATMLQSYCTAVYALTVRCNLAADETVLVLGAGGGVGLAMTDVATGLGARVIAAASTADKRAAALAIGAVAAIDTTTEDLKVRARELSGGGVDMVVDPVGGALGEPALRALGFAGRYLVVGFAGGPIPRIPLNLVLLNSRTVVGVEYGGVVQRDRSMGESITEQVIAGVAAGRYRPVEPAVVPLDAAGQVLEDLLERRVTGKVALIP